MGIKLKLGLILPVACLGLLASPFFTARTAALSGGEFQAGRIMDDVVFFNPGTMNTLQIQEFLNAKVPSCDSSGQQTIYDSAYGDTVTRAVYSQRRGVSTPFICLKDFRQDTIAKPGEAGLCNGYTVANQSAAEIIYNVAQSCGINPKVLTVLLQKEQSLVTDDWPWPVQYRSATGYGCPDTAACDAEYYGFFNQVYSAARQFKRYSRDSNLFNYRANTSADIYFNPGPCVENTSCTQYYGRFGTSPDIQYCGATSVFIQNQATAGLYNYTPYQPNSAALNNLYGTGDICSSYGNRNFWRLYNDWFGSTLGPNFNWSLESQALYTDSTKTTGASNSLVAGNRVYAVVRARNTGNIAWNKTGNNTVRFGTIRPLERSSPFCDPTWPSCSRPASMVENTVAPNEIATFEFWLKAPNQGGTFDEYFGPVVEGVQWMRDIGLFYQMHTQLPYYSWQMTSQYAYTDQTKTTLKSMNNLQPGEKVYVGFTAKNTGNIAWSNSGPNAVMAGTYSPMERTSRFSTGSSWLTQTKPALLQETTVAPGSTGRFEFWMTAPVAPNTGGVYHERFNILANGIAWFNDTGLSYYASVVNPTYSWQFIGQWAYSDANRTVVADMNNLHPGDKVYVRFTAKNIGSVTWTNSGANPVMAGTANPLDRPSSFAPGSSWLSGSRPVFMQNASIAPGQTATFEFTMTAPSTTGTYNERFSLIANNLTWFNDTGLSFYANVLN